MPMESHATLPRASLYLPLMSEVSLKRSMSHYLSHTAAGTRRIIAWLQQQWHMNPLFGRSIGSHRSHLAGSGPAFAPSPLCLPPSSSTIQLMSCLILSACSLSASSLMAFSRASFA